MTTAVRQLEIPNLRDPRHRRPMMTMEAAKGALDRNEDQVLGLVGTWLVAWNIASPDARRRELRILSRSVSLASKFLDSIEQPQCWDGREVLRLVLPAHDKPWFTGLEIQRSLNCASTHVIENLIEKKALRLMPGTSYCSGRGGSPAVQRESFIHFLEQRLEDARNVNWRRS
jgi:hypothetical protein